MVGVPRPFAHLPLVLIILAAASSTMRAQELKDRQLIPAYDFGTVQMPVEIVSIKLNGKDLVPGEKIQGNDEWLRGVSFTIKNITDQPLAYVNIGFEFPLPNGFVVYVLPYGVDFSHGEPRRAASPPAIQPGETIDLVLTDKRYQSFLHVLAQANAPSNFDTASFYVERVSFENNPDVIWQRGYLKKRHPTELGRFDQIGRYVLPDKPRR